MASVKNGKTSPLVETLRQEASRCVSKALATNDASADWLRAAEAEDQVACLLEAEGHVLEAAIHRFSAASCFARADSYVAAVAHARSTLSFDLKEAYRKEVEAYLKKWLAKAKKQLRQQAREQVSPAS